MPTWHLIMLPLLVETRRAPSLTNLTHRWEWIRDALVPSFRLYESRSEQIRSDLQQILSERQRMQIHNSCS